MALGLFKKEEEKRLKELVDKQKRIVQHVKKQHVAADLLLHGSKTKDKNQLKEKRKVLAKLSPHEKFALRIATKLQSVPELEDQKPLSLRDFP